jgi:hypothetical protein
MRSKQKVYLIGGALLAAAAGLFASRWTAGDRARPSDVSLADTERAVSGSGGGSAADRGPNVVAPGPRPDDAPPANWLAEFTASDDLFAFVAEALPRAAGGDHRAQYFVGHALAECRSIVIAVNLSGKGSLAENVEEMMAARRADDGVRRRLAEQIDKCERFFLTDPVADLPESEREIGYWLSAALEGGDAFALTDRALKLAIADSPSQEKESQRLNAVSDLREALATREPAIIFRVGGLYSNPTIARDHSIQGPAWMLAACSAGYDCSSDNPSIGFGCAELGTCNAGFTIPQVMQRDMTPAQYAKVYAASQDILYRIDSRDWDGLQQYLEMKL